MTDLPPPRNEYLLEGSTAEQAPPKPENPLLFIHRRMRGRYKYAVPLALVLAVTGSVVGYFLTKPKFESVGLVNIQPAQDRVLFQTEQNTVPPMFDAFVSAQGEFLRSSRVLQRTAEDPQLRAAGGRPGRQGIIDLQSSISVRRARGGQLISVSAANDSPQVAQAMVNAVLRAYDELYGEVAATQDTARETLVQDLVNRYANSLEGYREDEARIAQVHGGLESLQRNKAAKEQQLEFFSRQLDSLDVVIQMREQGGIVTTEASVDEALMQDPEVINMQLATTDSVMAEFLSRRRAMSTERARLGQTLGPMHRDMRRMNDAITAIEQQINDRREILLSAGPQGTGGDEMSLLTLVPSQMSLAQARRAREFYLAMQQEASRELTDFNTRVSNLMRIREQQEEVRSNLLSARQRLEALRVEKQAGRTGRVNIAQQGDLPLKPSTDRRIALAAMGAMGGFGAGFAVVFLLTFLDRSFRFTDEVEKLGFEAPLLGALPELGSADPEQEEVAALSVHHLRNMVMLHPPPENPDPVIYTVTSAGAGDGKTSLTLSLGMSFAASGMKTLLLDSDLLGRGLTRSLQMEGVTGLAEALENDSLDAAVHETSFANLWATPAGRDGAIEPERLNKRDLARLIAEARERFEIVLVDTGPLLGSLEANLVAGLSDCVVLVVSRGQDSKLVNACIQRLRRIGVHCAGVVFNRAEVQDFERSFAAGSVSSVRSVRSRRPDDASTGGSGSGGADAGLLRALSSSAEDEDSTRRASV